MLVNLIVQITLLTVFLGLLLFWPAGTLAWPNGWAFLAEMGFLSVAISLWLLRRDPGLLRERLSSPFQKGQVRADRTFLAIVIVVWSGWVVTMALDAKRWQFSHMPTWLNIFGAVLFAIGFAIIWRTFRANSFAAPVVKIQRERGQTIITTGPYAIVRHPMYVGAILYMIGMALLLGSWIGLACLPPFVLGLAMRIRLEERTLAQAFAEYRTYTDRVRYRLLPGVW